MFDFYLQAFSLENLGHSIFLLRHEQVWNKLPLMEFGFRSYNAQIRRTRNATCYKSWEAITVR